MIQIAIILGILEGLTEFIPVSSTGHLIVVGHLLGFSGSTADTFDVFIQLGAILAVVVVFFERFIRLMDFRSASSGFFRHLITPRLPPPASTWMRLSCPH